MRTLQLVARGSARPKQQGELQKQSKAASDRIGLDSQLVD
jgi:hypothetical protein